MNTQKQIMTTFSHFCSECELSFRQIGPNYFILPMKGRSRTWSLYFIMEFPDEDTDSYPAVVFLSDLHLSVPQVRRSAAALFLMDTNDHLHTPGAFSMNSATGEIRFQTVLQVTDEKLTTLALFTLYDAHHVVDEIFECLLPLLADNRTKPRCEAPVHDLLDANRRSPADLEAWVEGIDFSRLPKKGDGGTTAH